MAALTPQDPQPDLNPALALAAAPSAPQKAQRRTFCRDHCASCGRHFSSVEAFDRHRPGKTGQRKCVDPTTADLRLAAKSKDGVCAITVIEKATGKPIEVRGVTVWQTVEAHIG